MNAITTFKLIPWASTGRWDRGPLAYSQKLVAEFTVSIKAYLNKMNLALFFNSKNNIYRCTRIKKKFWIHEFSTKEFITTARLLHPQNTDKYLKKCFGKCANGTIQFVIFSTPTKAHAICEVDTVEF